MDNTFTSALLAAVPGVGPYVSPIKVGIVVALLILWALAVQWVDRDTDVVKTKRKQWNLVTLSGGFVAFVVLFVPPWAGLWSVVGFAFWLVLAGGSLLAYVLHRNGLVLPDARVLTRSHFKRLFLGAGRRKTVEGKGQRVRITDHSGEFVEFPEDMDEARDFQAAQDFLYELCWRRVSDADMVMGKDRYRLVYRIDGIGTEHPDGIPVEEGERVIRCLKRLAGLNVEEIRRPQTGRIEVALLSRDGDAGYTEVQTSGTTAGERLRLHVRSGPDLLKLEDVGIAPQRLKTLLEILAKPTGLFVISAKPRSGLTTTQYAALRTHDVYLQDIHTLERRPLLELDNITQRIHDGANADVHFARMLQSVLRREPDIVMIGECEDRETAQIASRAAAGDRKIYLGIHAKDCFDALGKYLAFVEDHKLASRALIGVINQRLVRLLCEECREAFRPDPATLKKLNLPADKIERFYRPPSAPVLDKKGDVVPCRSCQGTGYVGRTGVFELMLVDEPVSQLIAAAAPINKIKTQCRKNRMYYLQEEGLLKVIEGVTSMNEVLRSLRADGA